MSDKKINKAAISGRLFSVDQVYLEKKVKNFKNLDPKFKDNSTALRHYVHLGIRTEARDLKAQAGEDNSSGNFGLAKRDYGFTDSLNPVKNSLDSLIRAVELLAKNQENFFAGQLNAIDNLRSEILSSVESLGGDFNVLKSHSESEAENKKFLKEILVQIVILRSIHFVFLLGIKPGANGLDLKNVKWGEVVSFTHRKAQELADAELKQIENGNLNTDAIKKISKEIYQVIKETGMKLDS